MASRLPNAVQQVRILAAPSSRPTVTRSCLYCSIRSLSTRSKLQDTVPPSVDAPRKARNATALFSAVALGLGGIIFYVSHTDALSFASASTSSPLRSDRFSKMPVLSARVCNSQTEDADARITADGQHRLLRIRLPKPPNSVDGAGDPLPNLRIMSVFVKEPALQIERAYTPLHDNFVPHVSRDAHAPAHRTLDLLVKRYPYGELSRYIHRLLPAGPGVPAELSTVEVRGPVETWANRGPVPDHVIMVVGGTGITPAYQLLTSVLGRPDLGKLSASPEKNAVVRLPHFTLLYASPSAASGLLLPELAALARSHPSRLSIKLFVENEVEGTSAPSIWARLWGRSTTEQLLGLETLRGRVDTKALREATSSTLTGSESQRRTLLLCGPDEMVAAIAGPKHADGRSQGPLGGILKTLGWTAQEVYKL